jgi:zinc D-Ala-D-Ala carboxypeptidase
MNLSEHFTLHELCKSQTAERLQIRNEPNDEDIRNLMLVCENVLEPVRVNYNIPFAPSSGFRCPDLNQAIGSSDTSQHTMGQAVDFEIPTIPNKDVALWIMDNCEFDQLILEFYKDDDPSSGWVHCSYVDETHNRKTSRVFDGRSWSSLGEEE